MAEGRVTKTVPNTMQAVSKQKHAWHTSRESTQASKARGRTGHAKTAGHAKRGKKEGETERPWISRLLRPKTRKPWHRRCERQLKQASAGAQSEREGYTKPAQGQPFHLDALGVARKCPTEASKSQSVRGGRKEKTHKLRPKACTSYCTASLKQQGAAPKQQERLH